MAAYDAELASIARRRAIADALRQSGNQSFDPGAVAGRMVYKRSPLEDMAKVLQQGLAGWNERGANQEEAALKAKRDADAQTAINSSLDTLAGPSDTSTAGPAAAPDGTPLQQFKLDTNIVPGEEQNQRRKALAGILQGGNPQEMAQVASQMSLQKMMEKPKTTIVPYGSMLVNDETGTQLAKNDRLPGSTGGGTSADQQLINRFMQEQGMSFEQAVQAARDFKETFTNAEVAGVQGTRGNRSGAFRPDTNIDTVAGNANAIKAAEAGGTVAGKTETERFYDAPKARVKVDGAVAKIDDAIGKIDEIASNPGVSRATGFMSYFPSIRGGNAKDAETAIESLKIQLGYNELQDMRQNSPTGGALGNVSDTEGRWLQNEIQSLALEQSDEAFKKHLGLIRKHMAGVKDRLLQAYKADYENASRASGGPAAPQGQVTRKTYNPATGKVE